MNIEEACEFFGMSPDIMRDYEKKGLLSACKTPDGTIEIKDQDVRRLTMINTFVSAGADFEALRRFLDLWDGHQNEAEQIQILKKQRFNLLDAIHDKQRLLDRIDFIIQEIKNGK